jgi:hypothetical protein
MALPLRSLILDELPTLKSRLGSIRRRRRRASLKRFAAVGPLFVGALLLVLAAFGGIAGFR